MNKNMKIIISILLGTLITSFILSFFYFMIFLDVLPLTITGSILSFIWFSYMFYQIL